MNAITTAPCAACDDLGFISGDTQFCACPKGQAKRARGQDITAMLAEARKAEPGYVPMPDLPRQDVAIQDMGLLLARLALALGHAVPGHKLLGDAERMLERHGLRGGIFNLPLAAPKPATLRIEDLLGDIPAMERIDVDKWMREAFGTGIGITRFSAGADGVDVERIDPAEMLADSALRPTKLWPTPQGSPFTLERRDDPHNPSNRHNPLNMGRRRSDKKE